MITYRHLSMVAVAIIAATQGAFAEAPISSNPTRITSDYGLTLTDLNADGEKDIILRNRWDNGNAHSFDRYTIAILQTDPASGMHIAYEVPLGESSQYRIQTDEGAECLRTGYVFRLNNKRQLELVEYRLAEGTETYCEMTPMTTTTYRLERTEGEAGLPPFYLRKVEQKLSSQPYADVNPFMR